MATDDQQRLVTGVSSAPATFTVPGNGQMRPKSVFAHYDGTSALTAFLPTLKITSDAGKLIGVYASTTQVAGGGTADVSWFPGNVGSTSESPGPAFSGSTIVPLSVVISTRDVQPAPASFGNSGHTCFRTIIPRTGTLHDLAMYIGTHAGSAEVAILDTAATTRTVLFASGLIPVAGDHRWQVFGDPSMGVTVGDQLDISVGFTDGNNTVFWCGGLVNSGFTDAASALLPTGFVPAPLGGKPLMSGGDVLAQPYTLGQQFPEAALTVAVGFPLVIGRIS